VESHGHGGFDRSFYVFFALIGLVLVLTVIAYIVFGFPELTVPAGPEEE
jgi:hypothetical protein